MNQESIKLIQNYYAAFNAGDMDTFLSLLTDDVIHDINLTHNETADRILASLGRGAIPNNSPRFAG